MNTAQGNRSMWMKLLVGVIVLSLLLVSYTPASAKARPVRVKATAGWVDTKVWVEAGQRVSLKAKGIAFTAPVKIYKDAKSGPAGQISHPGCGMNPADPPPCALYGAPYGALVGRIGNGAPFLIGAAKSFVAPASGYLWLAVNDTLRNYKDNRGGYSVLFK